MIVAIFLGKIIDNKHLFVQISEFTIATGAAIFPIHVDVKHLNSMRTTRASIKDIPCRTGPKTPSILCTQEQK